MKDHMKNNSGGGDAAAGVASERPGYERPGEIRPQYKYVYLSLPQARIISIAVML